MARQIRRVNAAVLTELAQHRREQAARTAAVMQADDRRALIETAARRIRRPQMNLAEAALGVRATHMDDGGLRQRQTVTMFGLDHFEAPLVALQITSARV